MRVQYEAFAASSRAELSSLVHRVARESWGNILAEAHWHPNGFAVFRLEEHHPLGILRLHVWPSRRGAIRTDSPPIHSHAWHLYSLILAGTYRETLYRISHDPSQGEARHSAKIDYAQAPNDFIPGPPVYIQPLDEVECQAGEFHGIPAGVPHSTNMSEGDFAATLLITSPLQEDDVLVIGTEPIPRTSYQRPELSGTERHAVLGELDSLDWQEKWA